MCMFPLKYILSYNQYLVKAFSERKANLLNMLQAAVICNRLLEVIRAHLVVRVSEHGYFNCNI